MPSTSCCARIGLPDLCTRIRPARVQNSQNFLRGGSRHILLSTTYPQSIVNTPRVEFRAFSRAKCTLQSEVTPLNLRVGPVKVSYAKCSCIERGNLVKILRLQTPAVPEKGLAMATKKAPAKKAPAKKTTAKKTTKKK